MRVLATRRCWTLWLGVLLVDCGNCMRPAAVLEQTAADGNGASQKTKPSGPAEGRKQLGSSSSLLETKTAQASRLAAGRERASAGQVPHRMTARSRKARRKAAALSGKRPQRLERTIRRPSSWLHRLGTLFMRSRSSEGELLANESARNISQEPAAKCCLCETADKTSEPWKAVVWSWSGLCKQSCERTFDATVDMGHSIAAPPECDQAKPFSKTEKAQKRACREKCIELFRRKKPEEDDDTPGNATKPDDEDESPPEAGDVEGGSSTEAPSSEEPGSSTSTAAASNQDDEASGNDEVPKSGVTRDEDAQGQKDAAGDDGVQGNAEATDADDSSGKPSTKKLKKAHAAASKKQAAGEDDAERDGAGGGKPGEDDGEDSGDGNEAAEHERHKITAREAHEKYNGKWVWNKGSAFAAAIIAAVVLLATGSLVFVLVDVARG
eukprot:TRINITY_DN92340_c0_g1_i1.p1 TRINITY_DN92340_c0_g1~~TRINITY_DN92340_c0_g1_i1.p1  ORF type:complete len:439 (-),score=116.69 TRINITY_DN92340_c0_g1_i1:10-1326(-)